MKGIQNRIRVLILTVLFVSFLGNIIYVPVSSHTDKSAYAVAALVPSEYNLATNLAINNTKTTTIINNTKTTNRKTILLSTSVSSKNTLPLILDSKTVDYMSYIPKLVSSKKVKAALKITNPKLSIEATSAILMNSKTGKVLYYKKPTTAVFPGSTAKLLSTLVLLDWCKAGEKIKVGDEIALIPEDSSKAELKKGEVIERNDLIAAMLLPSGNDAAYVTAVYVGRKSLDNMKAKKIDAINEFVRLMNEKAKKLGAENSCFVTPDGYDAIGQYTTTYDMARIALAAVKSKTILAITKRCSISVTSVSGNKHTWKNTNSLIQKDSTWYNSKVIGLKTGTTTMAGRCLISAAKSDKGTVISVVMNSTSEGRWKDSNQLLNYGLKKLK